MKALHSNFFIFAVIFAAVLFCMRKLRASAHRTDGNVAANGLKISGGCFFVWFVSFALVCICFSQFAGAVFRHYCTPHGISEERVDAIANFLMHLLLLSLALAMARSLNIFREERRKSWRPISTVLKSGTYNFLLLLPLIMVSSLLWELFIIFITAVGIAVDCSTQAAVSSLLSMNSAVDVVIFSLTAAAIAPISEEIIFRAFLYRFLKGRANGTAACICAAIIFAYMHCNALSFFPLFTMGAYLTRVYERNGDIRELILLHSFVNLTSIIQLRSLAMLP
ncbi:MAG: CPBP family intramembrane metalloprotease [Puniceicoccales bacterium]|jgi:membrane protease YdiL (CAAX protease family)|nr:CPBP family intramembrane metalloprotease [Puniceicoccales bacterium]